MHSIVGIESLTIVLLLVVSLGALVVNWLRVSHAVALVLVGLALTFTQNLNAAVTPEPILALFIPPVAFEAAFQLASRHLQDDLLPLVGLTVFGGAVAVLGAGYPLPSPWCLAR